MKQNHLGPDRASTTGTPRWVKLLGIVVLVLILVVGIMLLTGVGGNHGPGRHMPSGAAGATPPSSVTVDQTLFGGRSVDRTSPMERGVQLS